jgi:hypothetical protein
MADYADIALQGAKTSLLEGGESLALKVAPFASPALGTAAAVYGATRPGEILAEPAAEPPPTAVVSGPSKPPAPPPGVRPVVPAAPSGANLGALGAQARKVGAIGADGMESAKEAGEKIAGAAEDRKESVREVAGIQQQKADAEVRSMDEQIALHQGYQDRLKLVRQGEEEAVASAKKNYNEALEDAKYAGIPREKRLELQAIVNNPNATTVQKASAKAQLEKASQIDPDQVLGTAGAKITAAIAMVLGGIGSGLTGGPNYAIQIIQQAIQDNIGAQKHRFAKKEREAEKAEANIDKTKAEFSEDKANALREYGIGLEMAKMKLGKITAGLSGGEAMAKAKELEAQITEEAAKNSLALEHQARGAYLQSQIAQGQIMTNQAEMQERRVEKAAAAAAEATGAEALEGYVFTGKTTPTKPALDRAQKAAGVKASGNALLDEAIRMREKYGSEHGGGKVQSRMEVLQSQIITMIGQMSDAGVIQPSEVERFQKSVGDITEMGFVVDRLKALKWVLNNNADAAARAAGFEPVSKPEGSREVND